MNHPAPRRTVSPSTWPFGWWSRLDTVVKLGLSVFVGSFLLIWGGMFLSRPDRSIPPYSIGSQEGTAVAVHVPPWTSDPEIETLIRRFRKVAHEMRNFGTMKIQPTTPNDPKGRYQTMTLYIFPHDAWAEPQMLHRYLAAADATEAAERDFRKSFENALRGYYSLEGDREEGRIGPLVKDGGSPATAAYSRELFKGSVTDPLPASAEPSRAPSLSPL